MTILAGVLIGLVWLAARSRRAKPPATPRKPRSASPSSSRELDGPALGIALGHSLAQHHDVPFGDPLPHGHLGSPSSVAFWAGLGSVGEEEDED